MSRNAKAIFREQVTCDSKNAKLPTKSLRSRCRILSYRLVKEPISSCVNLVLPKQEFALPVGVFHSRYNGINDALSFLDGS